MTFITRLLLFLTPIFCCGLQAETEKANVILIFADDLGYNDLSCFGSTKIKTPNLDRLASGGKRLTNFRVPSSVCSPSRAALLTACYPKRVDMHQHVLFPKSQKGLNPTEHTMAEHFKAAGYATAAIGKWHLGHYPEVLPRAQGFDYYFGIPYSNDMNHPDNQRKPRLSSDDLWRDQKTALTQWHTPLVRNEEIIELPVDQRTITRRYTDEALTFIDKNKDHPFFLYLPYSMPHVPLYVPADAYDPNPQNAYTCTVQHIDAEIGRLLDRVEKSPLSAHTYVIFTSDNGPWLQFKNHGGSALPLRNGKGTPFEGGQRVPFLISGPGIPKNTVSDEFVTSMDLLPSLATLTDSEFKPTHKIDGLDLSATLSGDTPSSRNEFLYYTASGQLVGLQQGPWKILRDHVPGGNGPFLFNLADDLSEKNNLAKIQPDKLAALTMRMHELDQEITQNQRPAWTTTKKHPWPVKLPK